MESQYKERTRYEKNRPGIILRVEIDISEMNEKGTEGRRRWIACEALAPINLFSLTIKIDGFTSTRNTYWYP
jgi:phage anti-repressor protein